jgi:hypothetical protein
MSILSQALQSELDATPALTATFELGGKPFKVGSRPLTAADFSAVNKTLPTNLQADPTQFDGQIDMLIRKTYIVDEEGELSGDKAFDKADKPTLKRLRVDVLSGMFRDLFGDQIGDDLYDEDGDGDGKVAKVDDAKGN